MDDKEIRRILISFLKVRYEIIRIYQEKSIGGSICDLMTVTDCLTGYEIKSDLDNYARIDDQVGNYDSFFNQNYIVVGKTHEKSVQDRVPDSWGIIVISHDNVAITRKAQPNHYMVIKCQLSILWKLELGNLLNFFHLPMFALKGKQFIQDRLAESVPEEQLSRQVAYELMHRDYSVYNAKDYTEYYENEIPEESYQYELVDAVSEMEQMTLDQWIEIFNRAQRAKKVKTVKEKQRPERPKHQITYVDIEVSPGVPWISKEIITEFARYLLTMKDKSRESQAKWVKANYEPITGNWFIENKNDADHIINCKVWPEEIQCPADTGSNTEFKGDQNIR